MLGTLGSFINRLVDRFVIDLLVLHWQSQQVGEKIYPFCFEYLFIWPVEIGAYGLLRLPDLPGKECSVEIRGPLRSIDILQT
jgi:hypothetical protein